MQNNYKKSEANSKKQRAERMIDVIAEYVGLKRIFHTDEQLEKQSLDTSMPPSSDNQDIKIDNCMIETKSLQVQTSYTQAVLSAMYQTDTKFYKDIPIGNYRYYYSLASKDDQPPTASVILSGKEFVFEILGLLTSINRRTNEKRNVYACIAVPKEKKLVFFVDNNGRLDESDDTNRYKYVLSTILPQYEIQVPIPRDIAKELSSKSMRSFKSMKSDFAKLCIARNNLHANNDLCNTIIDKGERILSNDADFLYRSDVLCLMGDACFEEFQRSKSSNPSNEYLSLAQDYSAQAIVEDNLNKQAFALNVVVNLFALQIDKATEIIKQMTGECIIRAAMETRMFELNAFMIHLAKQKDYQKYGAPLKRFEQILCERTPKDFAPIFYMCAKIQFAVFGDSVTAYTLISECYRALDSNPLHFAFFYDACLICLSPDLNKIDEAIYYGDMGMKSMKGKMKKEQANMMSCYGVALASNNEIRGEEYCQKAVELYPCDNTYFNYGKALHRLGKSNEGLVWAKKALYLHEDETNLVLLADIYSALNETEQALQYYEKAFNYIRDNEGSHFFSDEDGEKTYSIISSSAESAYLYYTLKNIISLLLRTKKQQYALAYLAIAKDFVPNHSEWDVFESMIDFMNYSQNEITSVKEELLKVKNDSEHKLKMSQDLVMRLIRLQDKSQDLNMDDTENWSEFENEINCIIDKMEEEAQKNSHLADGIKTRFEHEFSFLNKEAIHFLTTAEVLYEMHKNNEIDFACIVVEYCKVLELQLRKVMGDKIPASMKMLGQIIGLINDYNISPYNRYLRQLNKINDLRKKSAHTGSLSPKDVETIRTMYYDEGLLNLLK